MKNKRVGIITHWNSKDNYGQKLQAYALQVVLRNLGFDPFLIRYISDGGQITHSKWICMYHSCKSYIKYVIKKGLLSHNDKNRKAIEFIHSQLSVSQRLYTRWSILKFPPKADFYITGSDQVWNKLDGSYFLDFVNNGGHRISYAASFGGCKYTEQDSKYVKKWLKNFSSISVRENDGHDFCDKLGFFDSKIMPDPTFLLGFQDYKRLFSGINNDRSPYLFLYLLGHENKFEIQSAFDFANKHNLNVVYVASQGRRDSFPKEFPTVPQWLELLANAKYVITNSFHGTVFSLIFERSFISIPLFGNAEKMNDRLQTLLTQTSLMHRFTIDCNILLENVAFDSIRISIEKLKKQGLDFLNNSLNRDNYPVV